MRSEQEANRAVERYADMVRRLCLVHLKNEADTEDVFQTVFLKYVLYRGTFESEEHEKAWILRVTLNACRDVLRSLFRARRAPPRRPRWPRRPGFPSRSTASTRKFWRSTRPSPRRRPRR